MSAATAVEEDIEHLDFPVQPECVVRGCERHATWWGVCLSCRDHKPYCDSHRRQETAAAMLAEPGVLVVCPQCGHSAVARRWFDLFAFVPIRSA